MIDMVEARVIGQQIAEHLLGKQIKMAALAERKKKSMRDAFLLRVKPEDFKVKLEGTVLVDAYSKDRHIIIETDGGYGIDLCDIYGKVLYIEPGAKIPGNPPITLSFADDSCLIVLPGVWGVMKLQTNQELRNFRASSDPDLLNTATESFTVYELKRLLTMDELKASNIKQVLTKFNSPGIMSMMGAYSQEALYRAHIHPKRKIAHMTDMEIAALHAAVKAVTNDAIEAGGRASERDLFNHPGRFVPSISVDTEGKACLVCGEAITAINMGGAGKFYICPGCQVLPNTKQRVGANAAS